MARRWRSSINGATGCPERSEGVRVVGDVRDRLCIVVDDMIDTGGTIAKAAQTLFENGARDVVVAATGILVILRPKRLAASGINEVVVTNTSDPG